MESCYEGTHLLVAVGGSGARRPLQIQSGYARNIKRLYVLFTRQ